MFIYFLFRRIICAIFLCNKKCSAPCSFRRKGPSHQFNNTFAVYREFALRERKDGVLALSTISTLSLLFRFFAANFHLFFPSMPFQNAHYSRMRAFRQGNLPLYFVANYVLLCAVQDAQCNTEESPLKKNKNKKQKQKKQRLQLRCKCSNT